MADKEQLRILKQGVADWNAWRQKAEDIKVDLSSAYIGEVGRGRYRLTEADFRAVDLHGADLNQADFRGADLRGADLSGADLRGANFAGVRLLRADLRGAALHGANLSRAELDGANFNKVTLNGADLSGAYLRAATLRSADLTGADLSEAHLEETDLKGANLSLVNLREAILYETTISNVDLRGCKNLDSIRHNGPSSIDIRTLQRSGRLPLAFLRGVGLPDNVIDYLPSLLLGQAIRHYSCFISYSSTDDEFAHRLHADLQDKGVRCWFAPHDMKIGAKILDTLDEAIRLRDKVLLVLSEASIASEWVEDEVTKAFDEERQRGGTVLFPVRVDDAVFETKEAWAAKLRAGRNIGDFRAWKDHDAYQRALERVLRDLRVEGSEPA
jgi:hypothetical protein